jgi:carbonic anhydrase/acetyltransferase-like protein (isoleucine patch superfamily)
LFQVVIFSEIMIYDYKKYKPSLGKKVFIAPSADIIGNVSIGDDCSIWFNVTIRGDVHYIKIGEETNIQDNSILHVTNGKFPLNIGNRVTVAHGVALHGCTINDQTLVGIGAIVLDDVEVGEKSIIAAGSLLREGKKFPGSSLIAGSPARVIRSLEKEEIEKNLQYARNYIDYKNSYLNKYDFQKIKEIDRE